MVTPLAAETVPDRTLLASLGHGLDQLRLELDTKQREQLLAYVRLIDKWNRTFNLTAVREPERMIGMHLLDSLSVCQYIPPNAKVIDVGSGAGLPGIPLAIARPDLAVTMVDAVAKKAAFMQQAVAELRLANAHVRHARVEDLERDASFDIAISRAFAELKDFADVAARLLAPNGRLFAMKGLVPHDEISRLPGHVQWTETIEIDVPGVDGQRHLVVLSKKNQRTA